MIKIIPAILPQTFRDIVSAIEKVSDSVDTVQIDFVDGIYAPNKTWWFNNKDTNILDELIHEERGMPEWQKINYEFDLMIKNPLQKIDTFVALGPSRIIFHVESLEENETIKYFETLPEIVRDSIKFGIAISNDSDPKILEPYMQFVDSVQCMGISEIGFQGNKFDERVLDQIKKVKALYPNKEVFVDGAVSDKNAESLVKAGATSLIVGSFIFQNIDPRGTIRSLKSLCTAVATASEN